MKHGGGPTLERVTFPEKPGVPAAQRVAVDTWMYVHCTGAILIYEVLCNLHSVYLYVYIYANCMCIYIYM